MGDGQATVWTGASAGKPRRVRLTGRGRVLVLLVLLGLLLAAFAVGRAASGAAEGEPRLAALSRVTVAPGDTLWSLARQVAPRRDPREVVAQVARLNHLPGAAQLRVGQQLLLPASARP